jgi:hypothetical protein
VSTIPEQGTILSPITSISRTEPVNVAIAVFASVAIATYGRLHFGDFGLLSSNATIVE